ncbi:MAG: regulatory protein FlaEY [Caulobacter sp.]
MITFDSSALLSYYQARTGLTGAGASSVSTSPSRSKAVVPSAPWLSNASPPASELVRSALAGRKLIDEGANTSSLKGVSPDYKKLFATYQALNTLSAIAARAGEKGVTDGEVSRLQTALTKGLGEVSGYVQNLSLDQMRLTTGAVMTSDKGTVGVPKATYSYTTDTLYNGQVDDEVPRFQGNVSFDISVKSFGVTSTVTMNLVDMGTTPRTMSNVVSYMNGKMKAAGFNTDFSVQRTVGEERTVQVNGKPVKLPATGDDFALRVNGDSVEQLTFSAPTTAPAVYVTTRAGDPDPDKKTETDDGVFETTLTKYSAAGTAGGPGAGAPGGKVFSETLQGTISSVRKSVTGADGSIYMLADVATEVDGKTDINGQPIKGESDVALLKYDSAGHLLYARSLGATDNASGLSLAVADDGSVAVAGSVSGRLQGAVNGPINNSDSSNTTDSFVTRYDAKGDEQWTVRRGGLQEDEATAVAFGANGVLYVGGRSKSDLPGSVGTDPAGGWDAYLSAFATDANGKPAALFTQKFGTAENDSVSDIVVNGSQVIVGSKENGQAMLRSFEVNASVVTENVTKQNQYGAYESVPVTYTKTATLTAGATRDLGSLKGGDIVGLKIDGGQLYVGGYTANNLMSIGGATTPPSGGMDGFVGRMSLDISDNTNDTLTYYGGTGDDTVTGFAVSNGTAWLVGAAGKNLDGEETVGTKDGYVAQINVGTGQVDWSQRVTGKDGYAAPTSVAVSASGASALDAFGLPSGAMDFSQSNRIVSATSARAGDTFQIRTRERGALTTVTIDANDTLETLADKIKRASGFRAKVETASSGNSRVLKISPASNNATLEIVPGKGGTDVLRSLGIAGGVVRATKTEDGKTVSADGKGPVYGLQLPPELDLTTEAGRKNANMVITRAMSQVRSAYREIADTALGIKADGGTSSGKTGGTVPAYLKNQVANYQAALNRLTGG